MHTGHEPIGCSSQWAWGARACGIGVLAVCAIDERPTGDPRGEMSSVAKCHVAVVHMDQAPGRVSFLVGATQAPIRRGNIDRDHSEVGRGVPPVAARSTAPKVVSRHERAREDNNQPAAVWLPHTPLVHAKIDGRNRVGVNGVGWPDGGGAFA